MSSGQPAVAAGCGCRLWLPAVAAGCGCSVVTGQSALPPAGTLLAAGNGLSAPVTPPRRLPTAPSVAASSRRWLPWKKASDLRPARPVRSALSGCACDTFHSCRAPECDERHGSGLASVQAPVASRIWRCGGSQHAMWTAGTQAADQAHPPLLLLTVAKDPGAPGTKAAARVAAGCLAKANTCSTIRRPSAYHLIGLWLSPAADRPGALGT